MTDFVVGLATGIFIGIAIANIFLLLEPLHDDETEEA